MRRKIFFVATGCVVCMIFIEGCFYNKADQQYPSTGGCDTTNVRYSVEIKSILDANCRSCHEGGSSISGINLYNHAIISSLALNGQFTYGTLLSAIMHEGGAPEMPQGGAKLQDCDINKIAAWVHSNAPDN